jgi:hypothetical protein
VTIYRIKECLIQFAFFKKYTKKSKAIKWIISEKISF